MTTTRSESTTARPRAAEPRIPGTRPLGVKVRGVEALVRKVQAGFGFKHLLSLEQQSGLTRERIAQFAAIPPRTLARRQREGRLNAEESDRLLRASRVFEMAVGLFEGDVAESRHWLVTANPALHGTSPLAFCSTEVGAREVENLIGRLQHGVFA